MNDKARQTVLRAHLLDDAPPVVAAVSGGADSAALLHLLVQWGLSVTAVHIHHGIRGDEADRDADFVASLCARWQVPYVCHRVNVPELAAKTKRGVEETARQIRYELLEQEAARRNAVIATAHTLSDQTETVLLHMIRGTGSRGLCGMPYRRGRIIRPLLDCTRADVEAYCTANGLDYVQDSTNADCAYARNRLRNNAIPEMRMINPQLEKAIGRMCRQMRLQEDYMTSQAEALLDQAKLGNGYDAAMLNQAHPALRHTAWMALCRASGIVSDVAEHHVDALDALLSAGGAINLPGGIRLVCRKGVLTVDQPAETLQELPELRFPEFPDRLQWGARKFIFFAQQDENGKKVYKKSLYDSLDCDTISELKQFVWRSRRTGDVFQPAGRPRKTLKKLFNEAKIPVEQRSQRAVLEADGEIIWVEGFGASERAKAVPGAPRWIIKEECANHDES